MTDSEGRDGQVPPSWLPVHEGLTKWNKFMERTVSFPMRILEHVLENIHSFFTTHSVSCSFCMCVSLTVAVSASAIAVGVGTGVGVGCTKG